MWYYYDNRLELLSTISYSKYRPVSLQQILWHKSRQNIAKQINENSTLWVQISICQTKNSCIRYTNQLSRKLLVTSVPCDTSYLPSNRVNIKYCFELSNRIWFKTEKKKYLRYALLVKLRGSKGSCLTGIAKFTNHPIN